MSWATADQEQMISYIDASTCPFALVSGQSHGTTNQCMDKASITAKYVVNASAMSAYATNQLVPKKEWETPYSFTFYLYGCGGTSPITGYAATTTFSIGTTLYRDAALSLPIYYDWEGGGVEISVFKYGSNSYQVNSSGVIISITPCVTSYSFSFSSTSSSDPFVACGFGFNQTLYSADSTLIVSSTLFTNAGLTTAFNGASLFWFGPGNNAYRINSSGQIYIIEPCYLS